MNMTIRNKLVFGFFGLTGLLIIFGTLAWLYIGWLGKNIEEMTQWKVPAVKLAVDVHAGAYDSTIEQLNYLLYQKPETHERAKAVLAQMNQNLAEVDKLAQRYNDQILLQQSASIKQDVIKFGHLYDRGTQMLLHNKEVVNTMIDKGNSVLAEVDFLALKQETEYAELRKTNTPQIKLNSKVQKYIIVNKIKALALTIIQHEKQERLFKNRKFYKKMQLELPMLLGLFDSLQKITRDNTGLKKINVAIAATREYTDAASMWIKNDNELKIIIKEMNNVAGKARESATKAENNGWLKINEIGDITTSLVYQANVIIITSILLATFIGIMLSIFLPKNIAGTIDRFKMVIFNVEKTSDLTLRADVSSKDEIAEMALAFNNMLHTFQKAMNKVTDASSQIASASEETSVITEQTQDAIQTQQNETAQVSTAMNEMAATVSEVASNTTYTSVAANEAQKQVEIGTQSMQQTIGFVKELASIIQKASGTIIELEEQSKNIYSVLDVVNGIADQTNLLALNAAIEAARAGDHGRGFAVVADEVRNLAKGTQVSIGQITDIIEKLQSGSKDAVTSMKESQDQAENASIQAEKTGIAFVAITDVIQKINDMSSQIATAAEQQGVVAEEINRNIVQISEMTDQTAEGAIQTSDASKDLSSLASGLNHLVLKFRV